MHIESIPMRWGRGDNYAYLVTDDVSGQSVVIDPAEPNEVMPTLKAKKDLKLTAIINTHHHYDHAGGNKEMKQTFTDVPVVGGKDCPLVAHTPKDQELWKLGENINIQALHTPCHTQDSVCFAFTDHKSGDRAVFTGDTLFIAGCGRFFEGSAEEMLAAMDKLSNLPDDFKVYPGHEYTRGNLKFARTVLKNDALSRLDKFASENEHTTGKFTIADEREFNPFMRTDKPDIQSTLGESNRVLVMAKLREMKNSM